MASCTWTRPSALLAFLLLTILGGCSYKTGQLSYDRGDSQRAAEIWRRLAEWGDPAASLALGRLYLHGEGVPRDLAEAERLIRPVAKAADASMRGWALYHLGEIALEQKRPAQAADDFRQAAALENGWAKAALARLYLEGEGVAPNPGQAASLYREAAPEGIPLAYKALGDLYASGRSVPQDLPAAIRWYEQAKADGEPWAGFELAELYAGGRGVPADPVKAAALYREAAEAGLAPAQRAWGDLLAAGTAEQAADPAAAVEWYRKSADGGDAWAEFRLGELAAQGRGMQADPQAAAVLYRGPRMPGSRQPRSRWAIST